MSNNQETTGVGFFARVNSVLQHRFAANRDYHHAPRKGEDLDEAQALDNVPAMIN